MEISDLPQLDVMSKDKKGRTLLHWAAQFGDVQTYYHYMMKVEDKNPKDYSGETPFHWAAANGHFELCQLITDHVKDINPRDAYGRTPYNMADQNDHLVICHWIVSKFEERDLTDDYEMMLRVMDRSALRPLGSERKRPTVNRPAEQRPMPSWKFSSREMEVPWDLPQAE